MIIYGNTYIADDQQCNDNGNDYMEDDDDVERITECK